MQASDSPWDASPLADMAMAEILLTLTMFLACLAFARFAETRRTREAVWFALWTSAAVLTKGTGWAVFPIPLVVVPALRGWKLLLELPMRVAAGLIALLCLPWQVVTMQLVIPTRPQSMTYWEYVLPAMVSMTTMMVTVPGVSVFAGGVIGAYSTVWLGRRLGKPPGYWLSLLGLILATWVFHVVVPASAEPRRVLLALPPLLVFAGAGASAIGDRLSREHGRRTGAALFLLIAAGAMFFAWPFQPKQGRGFLAVAAELHRLMPPQSGALLVSDSNGEGSVIAEFALLDPDPRVYLIRASKLLASQSWTGDNYKSVVRNGEQCAKLIGSIPISFLVVDRRVDFHRVEFQDFVEEMLHAHAAEWRLVREFPSPGGSATAIALYRWSGGPRPLLSLPEQTLPFRYTLGPGAAHRD